MTARGVSPLLPRLRQERASLVLTLALTSPLIYILLLFTDPFEGLRSSSFIAFCELGAGALFNACLIYLSVAFVHRKWWT